MSLRRVLLAFVFTEISNQQLHAFICRDVCNIRMTHITRLGRIEIMKTFKSIMNRMILRYVALLLAICRGDTLQLSSIASLETTWISKASTRNSPYFKALFHLSLLTAANIGLIFMFFAKSGLQKSIF